MVTSDLAVSEVDVERRRVGRGRTASAVPRQYLTFVEREVLESPRFSDTARVRFSRAMREPE